MELPSNLVPDEANPEWMNKGDNAWQLTTATLVGLQCIPGLVIIYGGMAKKKFAINSAFMALYAFAIVMICWVGWSFRMSFGDRLVGFWGKPGVAVDEKFLLKQAFLGYFPNATMVFFQFSFAAITPILIGGALLGRMNFRAWMLFVPLWHTFSYTIGAYSIWCPDGWLAKLGIIDFAGGFVIHLSSGVAGYTAAYWVCVISPRLYLSSGVAGYTAAYWVGPRPEKDRENSEPNNILMMLAGAGLLWMGWTGFNGGAPYAASIDSSLAILNTHVCTATSLITWLILDLSVFGKPSVVGAIQGMVTGLVCITPAAGVVQCWAAIIMGVISGSVPWYTMMILQNKLNFLRTIDDPFSVLHTHALTGALVGILTGFFAVPKLCRLFFLVDDWDKYIGLAYGLQNFRSSAGVRQMVVQLVGMLFIVCLNIVMTSLICLFVKMLVPLQLEEEELEVGDKVIHGEDAYDDLRDGDNKERRFGNTRWHNSVYDADGYPSKMLKSSEMQMV